MILPLALSSLGLIVAAAALAVLSTREIAWPAIAGEQLVGLSYIVAGTVAWFRRPGNRIGPAILGAGIAWYIPTFVSVPVPIVTSASFAFAWVANLFIAFVLLTYPTGWFFSRAAKAVFVVAALSTVLTVFARLFLLDSGADFSSATGPSGLVYGCDCANPFALFPNDQLYGGVMFAGRVLTVLSAALVLLLIAGRWRRASSSHRRQLAPVVFAGAVGAAVLALDEITYMAAGAEQPILAATTVGLVLARAAVPIGFLLGVLRTQIDRSLVGGLLVALGGAPPPERLDAMVAATIHDPTARVGYWSVAADAYLDADGHPIALKALPGRAVALVERDGEPLCVVEYEAALSEDEELMSAVAAALRLAVDRDRLESMVRAQVGESRSLPRGPVTLFYADIQGSTALLELLGAKYGDVLAETRRIERTAVREHGGREIDSRADEFFAVFPSGGRPASAAIDVDRRLRDHTWPGNVTVQVRIGLHNGEPELGDEGYVGMDVHLAARLGSAGHGGQILVSASASLAIAAQLPADARQVDVGIYELRGIPGQQQIAQIVVPDLPAMFPPLRPPASPRIQPTAA